MIYAMKKLAGLLAVVLTLLPVAAVFGATRTIDADIAVVGAGSAGLAASVTAAENGAKVVLFEKMPFPGGTSNFAEGIFAVESRPQLLRNIRITKDEMFKAYMEYTHWRANPRLVRTFINRSAETVEWLESFGIRFDPSSLAPNEPSTWHLIQNIGETHHGAALVQTLFAKAKEKGVTILLETPAAKIIVNENKRIAAVVGQDKRGNEVRVNAKVVIMATGGFANNAEWVQKYTGYKPEEVVPLVPVMKVGDGIRMAMEVGADVENMGVLEAIQGIRSPNISPFGHLQSIGVQPFIWVNGRGDRIADESAIMSFAYAGNVLLREKGKFAWAIFDESQKKMMVDKGIEMGLGVLVPVGTKLTKLDEEIKVCLDKKDPNVAVADSIDKLADAIGIKRAKLKETIDRYNQYCDKNYDAEFLKDKRYLRPVKQAKFYAVKVIPQFFTTLGGVKINEKMEALDKNEEVIPGLYATGNDTGGMHGDTYNLMAPGTTFGFAVNSGRIAGENAAKFAQK
jgi:fumarate reductase flavoprotein subunit